MKSINVMIVDDEPLAHDVLCHHLAAYDTIQVVAQCYNATQALAHLAAHQVDVIFLDIQMPALSGLEMLKVMANRPQVVLCTAYQEHALEAFELDVTDYLLKPVSEQRFKQCIEKLRRQHANRTQSTKPTMPPSIVIRVDREDRKVMLSDIAYFESYGNYIKVWQQGTALLTQGPLKTLVQILPQNHFVQIHKSVMVNKDHVVAKSAHSVTLKDGTQLKIGKSFKTDVAQLLVN